MREVVIVEAVRTPLGKRNGGLSTMHSIDLLGSVQSELFNRSGVDPSEVGQVVGSIDLMLDGDSIANVDVVAKSNIAALGFFGRAWSNVKLLTHQFLMEE